MDFEKLTSKSKDLIQDVINIAVRARNQYISPLHLLKGLIDIKDSQVMDLILKSGGSQTGIRSDVENALAKIPAVEGSSVQSLMNQQCMSFGH